MTIDDRTNPDRPRLAIIGRGRVGASIEAYGDWLGLDTRAFDRRALAADEDQSFIKSADCVALAVPDDRIESAFAHYRSLIARRAFLMHFSGARRFSGLYGYHPLYSFPTHPLDPETTAAIAFAVEPDAPPLGEIWPGAGNRTFVVSADQRALYHALAVLAGNYAAFIWNEVGTEFQARLGHSPADILAPYLAGVVQRFAENPAASMTGPVARGDGQTIRANLNALKNVPKLHALYGQFLRHARPDLENEVMGDRLDG